MVVVTRDLSVRGAGSRWGRSCVGAVLALATLAACGDSGVDVAQLGGGGARPSCRLVGTAGDLDVDGSGTDWYGGLNLPDPARGGQWQPIAEGKFQVAGDSLTGAWQLQREPFGTTTIKLAVGDVVAHETETDESATVQIEYRALSGTVTVGGVSYPITGCRLKLYQK